MCKSRFLYNPIRRKNITGFSILFHPISFLRQLIINTGLYFGFTNIDYAYVHGDKKRIHLGSGCSTMNSIFNVISGEIHIGSNTILGHNCMVLTGTHIFEKGRRKSLNFSKTLEEETPVVGRDIYIGQGCFIGSGVIIIGPLTIGDNVIIGAGSVVTKSIQDSCFVAGVPAKVIKSLIV